MCADSRTNQKPYKGQITEIAPYVRTYYEIPSNINTMLYIVLSPCLQTMKNWRAGARALNKRME